MCSGPKGPVSSTWGSARMRSLSFAGDMTQIRQLIPRGLSRNREAGQSSSLRAQKARKAPEDRFENPPRDEDHRKAHPYGDSNRQDDGAQHKPQRPPAGVEAFHATLPRRPINTTASPGRFPSGRTRLHRHTIDLNDLRLDDLIVSAHATNDNRIRENSNRESRALKRADRLISQRENPITQGVSVGPPKRD